MTLLAVSLVVGYALLLLPVYLWGYARGVRETEERWADAVGRRAVEPLSDRRFGEQACIGPPACRYSIHLTEPHSRACWDARNRKHRLNP